ncbi:putative the coatomer is a cytosolic protein complex that binds to dilysine motifs and reversibly associates with Golgi non- clathrin-coated vesicles, which further mediate biosynthetic protein transport from the ER, via the Golgi up to the trans Golgi network [Lyophyllum shimeji]|uniref:Coatomer subunit beta' n=1 Tax=Lyophyllum shimeji TaxID=47721 RepID=A0A9P3PF69_LYOSH|nr:putative the coatomer is a cytosolic protein complex that binds to dilysine motifs and reversibly associates with Golgi non- clathrin-coated vesicles, which further mediate biosynthetic protein transport from the ER, via the Golgi up to the trans Golgi network [Lyophyllum shimeji]
MLVEVNRKLFARSDRVKGVDFHPTEPWLLSGLYNGTVPVRCVKFIARKNWFVAGSDDFQLRVFNYNTHEKVAAFEAHPDYIRCLTVHPTASIVLTGSDDMTIKAWDWEKGWKCIQVYEGHTHYIMNLAFNPKDSNTFASACLDRTVKMWSIGSSTANFTMDAHDKGVNYVDFYPGADKPYLVTTGDDKTVKVWDYLSKSCVQTMEGHTNNVSEDGTVKIWNSGTYRIENTLSYALERAWCMALRRDANEVAVGFDEGVVVIKLGRDEPTFSMDPSGKLVYTRNHDVLSGNLQLSQDDVADGARIALSVKEIGTTEVFAQSLMHSPNGRFVTVVGDGEHITYTALAWRNKAFGNGISFAWAPDSNTYAVLENKVKLKVYKNFRERPGAGMKGAGSWAIDGLHGGTLLGARGAGFVMFWDWETGEIVRRIDVDAKNVFWSGTGSLVAITAEDSFYILRFDRDAYAAKLEEGAEIMDEGVEEAFEVIADVSDGVKTAKWVGDCLIYTTSNNRLCYFVGNESYTISPFDTPLYLLGYMPTHNRIYLADKDMHIYGYSLSLSVVEYQTAVLRGDMEAAAEILPTLPKDQLNKVARFLESKDLKELAIQLDDLDTALEIAREVPETEAELKWKALGDRALAVWRFDLARECFNKAGDLSALMLLLMSTGDRVGLQELADKAEEKGQNNLAFATRFQLGDAKCAALFARTYAPSCAPKAVEAWKADLLTKKRPKIAVSIADPSANPEFFEEGWEQALAAEQQELGFPGIDGESLRDLTGSRADSDAMCDACIIVKYALRNFRSQSSVMMIKSDFLSIGLSICFGPYLRASRGSEGLAQQEGLQCRNLVELEAWASRRRSRSGTIGIEIRDAAAAALAESLTVRYSAPQNGSVHGRYVFEEYWEPAATRCGCLEYASDA